MKRRCHETRSPIVRALESRGCPSPLGSGRADLFVETKPPMTSLVTVLRTRTGFADLILPPSGSCWY